MPSPSHVQRRRTPGGFTLLELVTSLASAAVLVAGLASALMLTSKTLDTDSTATADNNRAAQVLARLTDDLQHASRISERTASAVSFEVPDRDGDGSKETLRYSWTGTPGDPLKYQYNSGTVVDLIANVRSFNLSQLNRAVPATSLGGLTTYNVIYEAFAETKAGTDVQSIVLNTPTGTADGRFLIAAIATDGGVADTMLAPAGWNSLGALLRGNAVGLNLYWKIAASEPGSHTFTWTGAEHAYGWIMRFNDVNLAAPINASATDSHGSGLIGLTIPTPGVTTTVANCMILRIIAVNGSGIATVPLLHSSITLDSSGGAASVGVTGGAAYANHGAAGDVGGASYVWVGLLNAPESVSWTLALAPLPPD